MAHERETANALCELVRNEYKRFQVLSKCIMRQRGVVESGRGGGGAGTASPTFL